MNAGEIARPSLATMALASSMLKGPSRRYSTLRPRASSASITQQSWRRHGMRWGGIATCY
eukprot:4360603-Pyramimonas_sp.AAC.1